MGTAQDAFEVRLPIGYTDGEQRIHRRATVRKMRGYDEDLLYDRGLSPGRMVTQLLANCVVRLGDREAVDAETVANLYTADRNQLLLQIRRLTLGDRMPAHYRCPRCGVEVAVIENLAEVEVRCLGEDEHLEEIAVRLEDGFTAKDGSTHKDLLLSLPRGVDEEFVSPMVERDPGKAQDALVLRCLRRFGTLSAGALESYGVKILRELTLGDRQRIQAAFSESAPGVNLQRSLQCGVCGVQFRGVMEMSSFFVAG